MKEHSHTPATRKKVLDMYQHGYSCKDISIVCGLSRNQVRTYLLEAEIDTRKYRKVTDSVRDKVILMIKAGYSYKQIERLLQVSTYLIREIVEKNDLVGFAPKNYPPLVLTVEESAISIPALEDLKEVYLSGRAGLVKCAEKITVSDDEFLYFVFHITAEDEKTHNRRLFRYIKMLYNGGMPTTAIAKHLSISPSIVKKFCKGL